jgi:ribosome biogenesis GTPase
MNGFVTKFNLGSYTVINTEGVSFEVLVPKTFKRNNSVIVGDIVEWTDNIITKVLPRKNSLIRPKIANVDQTFLIVSLIEPVVDDYLLLKYLVFLAINKIYPIILISKSDLANFPITRFKALEEKYQEYGFTILKYSVKTKENINEIIELLGNKKTLLVGQTGVGKSKLINCLLKKEVIVTNEISKALGRGKHTTTSTIFYPLNNSWLIDTPGFSSIDLKVLDMNYKKLSESYPSFDKYVGKCRFSDCIHENEPNCAVKEAVLNNELSPKIYSDYLKLLRELKDEK